MGQRHQVFIRIKNPIKGSRTFWSDEDKKRGRKLFGNGNYTTLAFHHQWLYGRSAVVNIQSIIEFTDNMSEYTNPLHEGYMSNSLDDYINTITMVLSVQKHPMHPRGYGIERFHFLNDDDTDYNIKDNFTWGDNNDGVTLIDIEKRTYCLVNIFDYDKEYGSVYSLPSMQPSSALDYINAYYPDEDSHNEQFLSELGLIDTKVMTLSDIKKMFPKMYKKVSTKA